MFENIISFFKKIGKKEEKKQTQESSKDAAKERLHLVLMQDRANVSADFLELMKQEIIDVIKKYIEVDEKEIDVRLTNKENDDGTNGAPALYANIPILNIKNESRKTNKKDTETKKQEKGQTKQEEKQEIKETVKENETQKEEKQEITENIENKEDNKEENNKESKNKKDKKDKKAEEIKSEK